MKLFLIGLTFLTSILCHADNWSDVVFGQLTLTKNFKVSGTLKKGLIFKRNIKISLEMEKDHIKDDVNDQHYANKSYHRVKFSFNDGQECNGISVLSTENETVEDIKYEMTIYYDREKRGQHCPFHVQIEFGKMEENIEGSVYARLTLYETNDFAKKKIFKGHLKKY